MMGLVADEPESPTPERGASGGYPTPADIVVTTSTTTSIDDGKTPYEVVPERLVQIDGRDYVSCPLHGLIPLDHKCSESPSDHWCREAAHPNYDPEDGDQGSSHADWSRVQGEKVKRLADALLTACLYLDGFVWLEDPEASEMDEIKAAVAAGLGCKNWEQAKELAELAEARRAH